MAITFADGVILGADSRTTTGAYIANRVTDKLTRVSDTIWCCRSGSAADTQAVADIVSYHLGMYTTMEGEQPTVGVAAGLFQEICYTNKEQLSAGIIIAGHHPSHGGSVYSIPLGGSLHRQSYAIGGSGSTYIYGYCDSYWKENMSEADGIGFVKGALREAIKWDGSSGGVIRMVVLTDKEGLDYNHLWDIPAVTHLAAIPGGIRRSILYLGENTPNWNVAAAQEEDMGTAVYTDTAPNASRYHPTVVMGDTLPNSSRRSESTRNLAGLAQTSRLPNSVSTQARIPSSSSTPTQSTFPTNRPRSASHSLQSSIPANGPSSQWSTQHNSYESSTGHPLQHAQHAEVAETPFGYNQNGHPLSSDPQDISAGPPSPRLEPTHRSMLSFSGSGTSSPSRIKVRDLNHIQSFASEEVLTRSRHGSRHSLRGKQEIGQQYEISAMPVTDIIEMVAGLLTKITTTNDRQHDNIHKHIPPPEGANGLSQQSTSVLAFHGKNVPSITILSYLSRIHKYCPTTYEVFLSLLVYFDRMTETVNNGSLRSLRDHEELSNASSPDASRSDAGETTYSASVQNSVSSWEYPEAMDTSSDHANAFPSDRPAPHPPPTSEEEAYALSHFFVVDSFNIHRLVIAAVTCASKFFSDVFYTNSRYAKVGGLPLPELNHLELQFLLLNDFRLSVPVEELEAYGTMLVEFYAREVRAQQGGGPTVDALYMQSTGH
ncbi:MAG: hypothetical protein Q9209_003647 [Squamulea sp. 1 TL-2023]